MAKLFDDVSRILGSPLPRRHAVRLIVGGLVGGYAARWPGKAMAAGAGAGASELAADGSIRQLTAPYHYPSTAYCFSRSTPACRIGGRTRFCCHPSYNCCYEGRDRALCCRNPGVANPGDKGEFCCAPIGAPPAHRCCDLNFNCCCYRNGARHCRPKASAQVVSLMAGQLGLRILDPQEGLTRIRVARADNATVDIPDFSPGAGAVEVRALKVDSDQPSRLTLEAVASCGPRLTCPSFLEAHLAELQVVEEGVAASQVFHDVSPAQSFVSVQNGSPGASRVQVLVNGVKGWELRVGENEVRGIDVAAAMQRERNEVIVLASGDPGAAALAMINRVPLGPKGPDASLPLPRVEWIPSASPQGVGSLWGM